ncbi:hypothetical protein GJV85_08220 [Sulfurimonas aquatica]|uniref:VWFA domain-containing protein n=1 Tax=Sulfurimonas aquatica TaxID=2672570 RepID=A0A975GCV4_9BACT|nr:Calx-beta domain-containing protein [Sulfurimonas aquatica]QSZ42096.1 hypothetical protein GJV85_08220 [Sulfurimonas aquatica]
MSKIIGYVTKIEGEFKAINADGVERVLLIGDAIFEGEKVVGDGNVNSSIVVALEENSGEIVLAGNEPLLFDTSLFEAAFLDEEVAFEDDEYFDDLMGDIDQMDEVETASGEESSTTPEGELNLDFKARDGKETDANTALGNAKFKQDEIKFDDDLEPVDSPVLVKSQSYSDVPDYKEKAPEDIETETAGNIPLDIVSVLPPVITPPVEDVPDVIPFVPTIVSPDLSINNVVVEEGSSANFVLAFSEKPNSVFNVKLQLTTDNGTAEPIDISSDMIVTTSTGKVISQNSDGTYAVPVGATSLKISVPTTADNIYEGDETFSLFATSELTPDVTVSGEGTITDNGTGDDGDDPEDPNTPPSVDNDKPQMVITPVTVEEGSTATFAVTVGQAEDPYNVTFTPTTATGSAESTDINPVIVVKDSNGNVIPQNTDGSYTVPAGETKLTVEVPTTTDGVYENEETFVLGGKTEFMPSETTAVGTITDNGTGDDGDDPEDPNTPPSVDNDKPQMVISDVTIEEGSNAVFAVTVGEAEDNYTVTFNTTTNGTAEATDITTPIIINGTTVNAVAGVYSYTVTAGTTSFNVEVPTTDDNIYEGSETFELNGKTEFMTSDTSGTGTITDNGTGPDGGDENDVGPVFDPGTPDNDTTSFSIGDVSISEGGLMTFTVTRVGDAEASQTIDFATSIEAGDNAEAIDFTGNSGTLTFATGVTSQTFTVQTTQDVPYEGSETFTATLSNNSVGSTITDGVATGTIKDDGTGDGPFNPGPNADNDTTSFSIGDVSISEGGLMTFTVTRVGDAEASQTIDFATSIEAGDNAEAIDFTGNSGTLTFATGVTSQTFTVQTTQDVPYEGSETFTATLSNNSTGSTITDAVATGTIKDDGTGDGPFNPGPNADNDTTSFSIGDVSISEGGLMTFTVTRVGDAEASQTIDFATSIEAGDNAEAIDFTGNSGTLTFASGVTSQTFTVQTTQDVPYEGSETFTATLSNSSTGSTITDGVATGTIKDDGTGDGPFNPGPNADNDTTSFSIGDVSISEGGLMTFTVTRVGDAEASQTIDFATSIEAGDNAESIDFTGNSGTLTFASGVTSQTFTVQTTQDVPYEGSETFTATLSNNSTGSTITDAVATGTIKDDGTGDGPFNPGPNADNDTTSFSIGDVSISEGGLMTFTVTRVGDAEASQTIDFATSIEAGDNAEAIDFTGNSGTLTFASGVTSQTFTVQTTQDVPYEGSETFTATLSNNSTGSTITDAVATGTIKDDGTGDGPFNPGPNADNDTTSFSIGDVSISEGGLMTFTVTRVGDAEASQTIDFATSIEAGDNAESIDFTGNSGTLTFASGVTSQTFTVQTTQDVPYEGSETFTATLSNNSTGSTITDAVATGTIKDDGTGDGPFNPGPNADNDTTSFSIGDVSISEGGLMTFTVTRVGDAEASQTIDFATSIEAGDNAEAIDFTGNSGTLTFATGVTSQTFTVQTTQDVPYEGSETFTATLSNNSVGSTITDGVATGTIKDDGTGDGPFNPGPNADNDTTSFSIGDVSISEGGLMTFTVTRVGDAEASQTIDFATSIEAGDNAESIDFTGNSGTLTFASGVTSQTFTVQTTQDVPYEGSETFTATLSNNSVGSTITDGVATGTIKDDGTGDGPFNPGPNADNDTTSFSIGDVSISEGGLMTFTVTRVGDAEASQTIDFATSIEAGDNAEAIDFTANTGTLTFASGVTSQTFTVQTTQDVPYEGSETFTATLSNNSVGSTITDGVATGTIKDDGTGDGPFNPGPNADNDTTSFSIGDVSISEGGLMTFTVTRVGDAEADQTIDFATSIEAGDNAEAIDFTANTGTLTFATGVTSQTFTVQTTQDVPYEGSETFTATLSNNSVGSTITDGVATGTIKDDGTGDGPFNPGPNADNDTTSFSIGDVSISEGGLMTFTVTRVGDAEADQTIDFATSIEAGDNAEAIDFTANTGTLTFASGVTSQTFTVQTTQDVPYEGSETFTATLSNNSTGSTITDAVATGTIKDDGTGDGPFNPGPNADNDTTSFSIGDVSISEGGLMTFTVTRVGDAEASQTIDFATSIEAGDNAEAIDFTGNSGTLTFATGVTSQTFTVQTTQDVPYEGSETFTATLSNNSVGSTITDGVATGTIKDDGTGDGPFNPGPNADNDTTSFSIGDVSISEGGLMTFTVTRVGDAEADQTIDFATSIEAGDNAEAIDFTGNSGTLTFATGVTSQTFTVQTTQDVPYEGSETFTATLSNNSTGSTITDAVATGTIKDDGTGDGPFNPGPNADNDTTSFSIGDVSISEGGLMTFTVTRVGDAEASQTIDFATSIEAGDNAEAIDFTGNSGTLTFASGVTSQTFTVQTTQDVPYEGSETFTATLSNNSTGSTITDAVATGTIKDDGTGDGPFNPGPNADNDTTSFSIGDVSISEGGLMTFTVTRVGDAEASQTIDFATSIEAGDNAESIDFTGNSGTLTFASGVTSQTFTVQTTQDVPYEGSETFTATLSNNSTGSTITDAVATGTIKDDGTGDGPFNPGPNADNDTTSFSIGDVSISEGGLMTFTVTRVGDAEASQTIDFATSIEAGDNAEAIDFTGNSGTLTFATGVTSQTFTVQTTQDVPYEGSETFTATLSNNSVGSTITDGVATGTIKDDGTGDGPFNPGPNADNDTTSFSIGDVSISEGGLMTFTVTRVGDAEASQTIDFATSIEAGDNAEAIDFTGNSGTLTFATGVTSQTFTVQTTQDVPYEGSETFTATLSNNSTGSTITDAVATGTIKDDGTGDGPFNPGPNADNDTTSFSIGDVSISEGGLMTFTVTRVGDAEASQTIDFATSIEAGDNAEAIDFTGNSGTLTFASGVTSQTFTVQTTQDVPYEGSETFTATLSNNSTGSTITDAVATGTIKDDGTGDGPFNPGPNADNDTTSFSIGDVSISEGGLMTFTVTRVGDAEASQTIDFATSIEAGDNAESIDFTGNSGTLTFASGVTSQTFTVQTTQDVPYEGSETFTATLSNNSTGSTITDAVATGTIKDDGTGDGPFNPGPNADNDTTSFSIGDVSISEGGLMTFTVTRVGDAEASQTIDFATSIEAGDNAEAIDFTGNSGTLTFATGVTSQTFTVQTTQDVPYEGSETFTATLSNNSVGSTITDGVATGTIKDDGTGDGPFNPGPNADNDTTSFSIGDVSISEGGLMTFTVTRVGDAEASQTIDFATSIEAGDNAEAIDFTGNSGTLTFATGVTSQTFTVQTTQDVPYEGSETFTATLSNNSVGSTITDGVATGTIKDDGTGDGPFNPGPNADNDTTSFSIGDVSISEGGLMTFTVTRVGDAEASQTIDFATSIEAGDNAEAIDFTGNSGTLTFATGVTSQTFTVQTTQDVPYEGSETFTATLSNNSTGSTITDAVATGTIKDDGTGDGPFNPGPNADNDTTSFSIGDVSISEGGLMTFTVTRVGDAEASQTIDFATSIEAGDNAEAIDFTANTGTLTFASGVTSQTFTVQTTQDVPYEGSETFTATLSNNSVGSTITDGVATGTIKDDGTGDGPFNPGPNADNDTTSFSIGDVSISEGGLMTFTVTRVGDAEADQTIDFATSIEAGDNAEAIDFTANTGTLTFATGVTSQTFTVQTTQDVPYEGSETFTATLSNNSVGSTITDGVATGTIKDDGTGDGPFNPGPNADNDTTSFSIGDVSISEGGLMTFTVTRVGDAEASQTIDFATSIEAGDNAEAIDFTGNSGTLTFATGVTSQTFTVQTTQDVPYEGSETFTATLSNNSVGSTITDGVATGTIKDDGTGDGPFNPGPNADNDTTSFSIGDVSISEGGLMTFTVTRVGDAEASQTIDFATSIEAGDNAEAIDFTGNSGTLTFATGVTSQTFTVQTTQDVPYEGSETFTATLSNNSVGSTITDGVATGTIKDDGTGDGPFNPGPNADNDRPTLSINSVNVNEASKAEFSVSISNLSVEDVVFDLSTSDGTALVAQPDYTNSFEVSTDGGTIWNSATSATIAAGSTSILVRVPTNADVLNEGSETFDLVATVTAGTTTNVSASGTATILDNYTSASIGTPTDVAVDEDDLADGNDDTKETLIKSGDLDITAGTDTFDTVFNGITDGQNSGLTSNSAIVYYYLDTSSQNLTASTSTTAGGIATGNTIFTVGLTNTTDAATAGYTFELTDAIDHVTANGENVETIDFGFKVQEDNNTDNATSTFSVSITDDIPLLNNAVDTLNIGPSTFNVVIIMDISGSMAWDFTYPDGGGNTSGDERMNAAINSANAMIDAYNELGEVNVMVTKFTDYALVIQSAGSNWLSASTAKTEISALSPDAGTWYDTALSTTYNAYITDLANGDVPTADYTYVYFLSDGEPTPTHEPTDELADWATFINGVDALDVVGITASVATATLNDVAGVGDANFTKEGSVYTVTSEAEMQAKLVDSTTVVEVGNIISNGATILIDEGADGAYVQSIVIGSKTYTYSGNSITNNVDATVIAGSVMDVATTLTNGTDPIGSSIKVDFSDGSYSYTINSTLGNAAYSEVLSIVVVDNDGDPITKTLTFDVNTSSGLPVIDLDLSNDNDTGNTVNFQTTFTEGGSAVSIADTDSSVTDADSINMASATIVLTNAETGDTLDVSSVAGLTTAVDTATPGVITVILTGSDTLANYETAIEAITFSNSSDNPNTTDRIITVKVNDGSNDSALATSTISVAGVNDAPTLDLDANDDNDTGSTVNFQTTFTEGAGAISISDVDSLIADIDDTNIESATIVLTNAKTDDALSVAAVVGLTTNIDTFVSGVITVTLTGSDTLANYQTAIEAITFNNTNANPDTTDRVITVKVNDGDVDSNVAATTISVSATNSPTVVNVDTDSTDEDTTLTVNAAGGVLSNDSDVDDTLTVASFTVDTDGNATQESFTAGQIATIVGKGTLQINTDGGYVFTPVADYNGAVPTATYTTNTGSNSTLDITVNPVNDAAILDLDSNDSTTAANSKDFTTSYALGEVGVSIGDVDVAISDVDDTNIESATITLTNKQVGDILFDGNLPTGITASAYNATTGIMTLSGSATLAEYETAIEAIKFYNSNTGADTTARTVTVVVNDGTDNSNTATTTIDVATNALSVRAPEVVEEGKSAIFIVELKTTIDGSGAKIYLTTGGVATSGSDYETQLMYESSPGVWTNVLSDGSGEYVVIPNGETRADIKVKTIDDSPTSDDGESLTLTATIDAAGSGTLTSLANTVASAGTTITEFPSLTVSAPNSVTEGSSAIFEVALTNTKATTTDVTLALSGEAISGTDYLATYEYSLDEGATWVNVSGAVTMAASATIIPSFLVRVTTSTDALTEGNESLVLTATTTDAAISPAGNSVSGDTVIVDALTLSISEEKDGVAIANTTTVTTAADANYNYIKSGEGANGSVTDNGDGTLTYTANTDFSGTDTFSYVKVDKVTGERTGATANVTVTAVADTPDITISFNEAIIENIIDSNAWNLIDTNGSVGTTEDVSAGVLVDTSISFDIGKGDFVYQSFDTVLSGFFDIDISYTNGGLTIYGGTLSGTDIVSISQISVGQLTSGVAESVDMTGFDTILVSNVNSSAANITSFAAQETVGATNTMYDVNITNYLADTDTQSAQNEELQDVTLVVQDNTGTKIDSTDFFNQGSYNTTTDTWTFIQTQLVGLTITVTNTLASNGFKLVSTATSQELSNSDTASATVTLDIISSNDTPIIGDNTLIMANEVGFSGTISESIDTYFSTDGGNTFTWDTAKSNIPDLYVGGELVVNTYNSVAGTVTGSTTTSGTVYTVTIAPADGDNDIATGGSTVTYNQPSALLGVEVKIDGGIVLPGGGNNDTIILGFNNTDGSDSGVNAIVVAHDLIEDTAAEISSPTPEHTVNTNNFYIGVDSNNMNAGQQLIFDFATVGSDGSGNSSTANEVSSMDIKLFNFGSEKSGDELYITVKTATTTETILLTQDSDYTTELEYTVKSANSHAITSVEFLAGNESSFKLGIQGISAIDYNTDFDMTLAYAITDADGDSDIGSVTISLDGDEVVVYDSTKTSIDAGDEQTGITATDDTLVFSGATLNEGIDFSTIANDKVKNFEVIDLNSDADSGNDAHTLTNLSLADVVGLTDVNNELKIDGDSGDTVNVLDEGGNTWTKGGPVTEGANTYDTYTNSGDASVTVKIDTDINDNII